MLSATVEPPVVMLERATIWVWRSDPCQFGTDRPCRGVPGNISPSAGMATLDRGCDLGVQELAGESEALVRFPPPHPAGFSTRLRRSLFCSATFLNSGAIALSWATR